MTISLLLPGFPQRTPRRHSLPRLCFPSAHWHSFSFLLPFPFSTALEASPFWAPQVLTDCSHCRTGLGVGSSLSHLGAAVGVHRPRAHAHQHSKYRQRVGTEWELEPTWIRRGGACSTRLRCWVWLPALMHGSRRCASGPEGWGSLHKVSAEAWLRGPHWVACGS